jgi:DNA-binding transcriptional MerR regulator
MNEETIMSVPDNEPASPGAAMMKIGELARRAGVNTQSIRFYERRKLLAAASRTQAGYRVYGPSDLELVQAIKKIQGLGFTLKEIKELLDLHATMQSGHPGGRSGVQPVVDLALDKIRSIDEKLRLLQKIRRDLSQWVELIGKTPGAACPVARTRRRAGR